MTRFRRTKSKKKRAPKLPPRTVTVAEIGGQGDGVAMLDGRRWFIPYTVPGDEVVAEVIAERGDGYSARVVERIRLADGRRNPPCPQFGTCGGCALQHLSDRLYRDWKRDRISAVLARRGIRDVSVEPTLIVAEGTRRRVTFKLDHRGGRAQVGFHARASHALVPVDHCLLLTERLNNLMTPLTGLAKRLLADGGRADVQVTDLDGDLDMVISADGDPDLDAREALATFARDNDLARLSWGPDTRPPEPILAIKPVAVRFGSVAVPFPAGGFLQASREGEAALQELALGALKGAVGPVLDLFAGLGTFTFPQSAATKVHAVEGDVVLTDALLKGANGAGLAGRITAETRNLELRPFGGDELKPYSAVIFDPPRAGAKAQAERLADSTVPLVIGVSCHPATFARDARILIDGGYRLERVIPVDQFLYSPHIELVGLFRKA